VEGDLASKQDQSQKHKTPHGTWCTPGPRRGLAGGPGLLLTFQRGPESRETFLEI
jgi:hypothetical protein